ncbi:hypothetical protein PROFUN_07015 [Planoprotostelium fungivorum]|uniref:PH domain-containing protein n=1 Tax=Planoprotostelium fungivorum TaxID=1890364 RepID=A0A2P6NMQ8_9EUKA|nr:hypothetical protein PROFUN_07015 [Planoprotostelium fungivorum]
MSNSPHFSSNFATRIQPKSRPFFYSARISSTQAEMDFFRKKKSNSDQDGKSPASPGTITSPPLVGDKNVKNILSPLLSPTGEGAVIIRSPQLARSDSPVNDWKESGTQSPLSPTSVYASGCRSPLEPRSEKENIPSAGKSRVMMTSANESPKLSRRMATPVSSPQTTRKAAPTPTATKITTTTRSITPHLILSRVRVEISSPGEDDVQDTVTLTINPPASDAESDQDKMIMDLKGDHVMRTDNLHSKKLVLMSKPKTFVLVSIDTATFITLHLSRETKPEEEKKLVELFVRSCHVERKRWKQETSNVKAVATSDYDAGDLKFHAGDVMTITGEDSSGYLFGEFSGNRGKFPPHLVEIQTPDEEIKYHGDHHLQRVTTDGDTLIDASKVEFSKSGNWCQGWVQARNHSTSTWSDCYLQAKTCGILTYQSSKLPDEIIPYDSIWDTTFPTKDADDEHPHAFTIVNNSQRFVFAPESRDASERWLHSIKFMKKMIDAESA